MSVNFERFLFCFHFNISNLRLFQFNWKWQTYNKCASSPLLNANHWHGDVPKHLAQPWYVALGRALDLGLIYLAWTKQNIQWQMV